MSAHDIQLQTTIPLEALEQLRELVRDEFTTVTQAASESHPYLTADQAADYLATSRDRIYELKSKHRIPSYADGRRPLFKRCDLDAYVSSNGTSGVS